MVLCLARPLEHSRASFMPVMYAWQKTQLARNHVGPLHCHLLLLLRQQHIADMQ